MGFYERALEKVNSATPQLPSWRIPLPVFTPRTLTTSLGETGSVAQGASTSQHHHDITFTVYFSFYTVGERFVCFLLY